MSRSPAPNVRHANGRFMRFHHFTSVSMAGVILAGCGLPERACRPVPLEDRRHGVALVSGETTAPEPPQLSGNSAQADNTEDTPLPDEVGHSDYETAPLPLKELVAIALSENPTLVRLHEEAAAAWARVPQVEALPDPMAGTNVFGHPIETAAGSQRGNLTLSQMIPWLSRLKAQGQQAAFEALAAEQVAKAETLRVEGDVKTAYFQLYVLGRQIEINEANQDLLESLVKTATALVGQGKATQADVLLGALELSRLEEQLLEYERQVVSLKAELNRLLNRSADSPIALPEEIAPPAPEFDLEGLRQLAFERQPEIAAAHLRTQATQWGLQVACLRRRPDVTVSFGWFFIDDNRPPSRLVEVGEDAWSVGASVTLPIWEKKYDAVSAEATHRHFAAHAASEDVLRQYDARLRDLLEQARVAHETAELYRATILPLARQTLDADLSVYGQPGGVDFDRVVEDFRRLLTLEIGYHRALGTLGVAIARLEQATATELAHPPKSENAPAPEEAPDGKEDTDDNDREPDAAEPNGESRPGGMI